MSILIVHGPHTSCSSLPQELQQQLQEQAGAAGCTLELRGCSDLRHFVGQVCAAGAANTEFVLLDPGDLAAQVREHPEAGLVDALDQLGAPYIEVHEAVGAELEHDAGFHKAPLATVIINGNIGSGYRIGLGIALRQLQERRPRNDDTASNSPALRHALAQRVAGL